MAEVRVRGGDQEYNSKGESRSAYVDRKYGRQGQSLLGDYQRAAQERGNAWSNFLSDSVVGLGASLAYILGNDKLRDLGDNYRAGLEAATGQPIFRRGQGPASREDETDRRASAEIRSRRGDRKPSANIRGTVRGQLEAPQQKDLADFLSQAGSMMGGGPDYSALRAALTNNAADVDARLSAMYRALENSIDADTETIGGFYSEANDAVSKSAEQAANNIQQGYEAAQQSQNDELARLGIQDAAAQNTAAAGDQGFQMGQAERSAQISRDSNSGLSANAKTFNTNMANAAGFEGAEARGFNRRNLAAQLGELSAREAQTSAQRRQAAMDTAVQMLQQDQEAAQLAANGGLTPYQRAQIERDIYLKRLDLQNKNQGYERESGALSINNMNRLFRQLQEQGLPAKEIQRIMSEAQAAGLF